MNDKRFEGSEAVFGHINTNLQHTREALHEKIDFDLQANGMDVLDADMELRLQRIKGDADILAYALHQEDETRNQAARAAYRGITFAHMVLDELAPDIELTPLDQYWQSCLGRSHSLVEDKIITDSQAYLYEHDEVNDLLAFYMFELSEQRGYEHMVEIGAAMVFRQAEIEAAMNEILPHFQLQLEEL